VYDVVLLPKPFAYLYGFNSQGCRPCGGRIEKGECVGK